MLLVSTKNLPLEVVVESILNAYCFVLGPLQQ